jgi:hypothetical protein
VIQNGQGFWADEGIDYLIARHSDLEAALRKAASRRRRRREWVSNWLVGGGGDGGGSTGRSYKKKPSYGNTVKSSLIQDNLIEIFWIYRRFLD